jgi:hypothetical protein
VTAVAIWVAHWHSSRSSASRRLREYFYLDNEAVMDLYLQHEEYKGALRHEVEDRISSSHELTTSLNLAPVEGGGKRGVNREVFQKYIKEDKPITVISIVIDVLDKEGDIVHVNLRKKEITSDRALDKALDTDHDELPPTVRLCGLDTFVLIRGLFRVTDRTDAATTFEAPYGDLTDDDDPQVRLTCAASGLRSPNVRSGSFPARCLGRVEDWNPHTHRLTVHPIAIFH